MKSFTANSFLLLSIATLFMTISVSATGSDIHLPKNPQDHVHLLARQDDTSSIGPPIPLNDSSSYPSFSSTDTIPDSTSTSSSISFSILGEALIQDINCKNCSAQGDISLQATSGTSSDEDSSGWSLTAAANGVSAHVEIEASLRPDTELGFQVTLKEIELESFEIAGVVVVTPKIVVELAVSGGVNVDIDVELGFDAIVSEAYPLSSPVFDVKSEQRADTLRLKIPDGASIVITSPDGTNLSASVVGL